MNEIIEEGMEVNFLTSRWKGGKSMKGYKLFSYAIILLVIGISITAEASAINKNIPQTLEISRSIPVNTNVEDNCRDITTIPKLKQEFSGRFDEAYTYGDDDFYLDIKTIDNSELTFTSKNTNIVTVSQTGKVSIVGAGTTYIIVTANENEHYLAGKAKIRVKIFKKSIKHLKLVIPQFGDTIKFSPFGFAGNGNSEEEEEEYDLEALYDRLLFFDGEKCLTRGEDYEINNVRLGFWGDYVCLIGINNYKSSKKFNIGNIYPPRMTCLNPINNGINVAWDGSDYALGYIVYRKTGKGNYKEIARIDSGKIQTYFDAQKKTNGKFYTYKVKVITRNKKKYLYKISKNTITLQYLTPPTKLKLHQKKNGQVYATWQGNKKADGYEVCCLENKNDNKNDAFKYTFKGRNTKKGDLILLKKGQTAYVYVRAYTLNKDGRYYSDWSKGKKIKVK